MISMIGATIFSEVGWDRDYEITEGPFGKMEISVRSPSM